MYGGRGEGDIGSVLGAATIAGGGAVLLPSTDGNMLGTILAYTAISIGGLALASQIFVRIIRRIYG